MKLRKLLQVLAGLAFLALVAGYSFYQAADYRAGAQITISSPEDGALMQEPLVTITGQTKRVAYLTLNGRQIFTDRSGRFSETLLLEDGYNIITIAAEDTFNRETHQQIGLVYRAPSL